MIPGGATEELFDPYDLALLEDPYPSYARLRREAPVIFLERYDVWVLSRYDDVVRAWRDPATFSSSRGMGEAYPRFLRERTAPSRDSGIPRTPTGRNLVVADPPMHNRLRRLLTPAFTPRATVALEGEVRALCRTLVDQLLDADRSSVDLAQGLAHPLPINLIARLMDIPDERIDEFKRWSSDVMSVRGAQQQDGALDASLRHRARYEMWVYFDEVVRERTRHPGQDLISRVVVGAKGMDDVLTHDDLVDFATLLLIAGNETTTNLLSNLLLALLRHPDQLRLLRDEPARIPAAIEEGLRFDPSIQGLFRWTTEPVPIRGATIPADQAVWGLFASANRDAAHFAEPDRFDVTRGATDHLTFGSGVHLCLGAPLARLELRVALEELLGRVDDMALAGTPQRMGNPVFRGLASLPVALTLR